MSKCLSDWPTTNHATWMMRWIEIKLLLKEHKVKNQVWTFYLFAAFCVEKLIVSLAVRTKKSFRLECSGKKRNINFRDILFSLSTELSEYYCTIWVVTLTPYSFMKYAVCCPIEKTIPLNFPPKEPLYSLKWKALDNCTFPFSKTKKNVPALSTYRTV